MTDLSECEQSQLIALLGCQHEHMRLNGCNLPQDVFFANCLHGMSPTPCVEVFALDGRTIYLSRRDPNDPYFAEKMALPGSVLRRGENEDVVLERALREFEAALVLPARKVTWRVYPTARGDELALMYSAQVDKSKCQLTGVDAGFYPFDDLPADTIDFHVHMIRLIAEELGWT